MAHSVMSVLNAEAEENMYCMSETCERSQWLISWLNTLQFLNMLLVFLREVVLQDPMGWLKN